MSAAYLQGPAVHYEHRGGCTGKHAFLSRADADHVARRRNIRGNAYQCPHCGSWHLSSRGKVTWQQLTGEAAP